MFSLFFFWTIYVSFSTEKLTKKYLLPKKVSIHLHTAVFPSISLATTIQALSSYMGIVSEQPFYKSFYKYWIGFRSRPGANVAVCV